MNFPSPTVTGTLLKHYRRNLADVRLNDGRVVTAHVFFPGPLTGCNTPGSTVLLSDSGDRTRKNQLTWEAADVDGVWVGVNPKISKHALLEAITLDQIDSLRGYRLDDGTIAGTVGTGDILLHSMKDNCLLSYRAVVMLEGESLGSLAKGIDRLMDFARNGHRAIVFCHVLRNDCTAIGFAGPEGKKSAMLLRKASAAGVEFLAFCADVSPDGVGVGHPIPWVDY